MGNSTNILLNGIIIYYFQLFIYSVSYDLADIIINIYKIFIFQNNEKKESMTNLLFLFIKDIWLCVLLKLLFLIFVKLLWEKFKQINDLKYIILDENIKLSKNFCNFLKKIRKNINKFEIGKIFQLDLMKKKWKKVFLNINYNLLKKLNKKIKKIKNKFSF